MTTQTLEIEVVEAEETHDDDVLCKPWQLECGKPAIAVWIAQCCWKEFPICASHDPQVEREVKRSDYCAICNTDYTDDTWMRVPLGGS